MILCSGNRKFFPLHSMLHLGSFPAALDAPLCGGVLMQRENGQMQREKQREPYPCTRWYDFNEIKHLQPMQRE